MVEMGLGLKSSNSQASILGFPTFHMLVIKRLCDARQLNHDKSKDKSVTSTLTFQ